jgi:hypothetical protein
MPGEPPTRRVLHLAFTRMVNEGIRVVSLYPLQVGLERVWAPPAQRQDPDPQPSELIGSRRLDGAIRTKALYVTRAIAKCIDMRIATAVTG